MDSFWITPETFKSMYGDDYTSVALFGLTHIVELLIAITVIFLVYKLYKKSDKNKRDRILLIVDILILIDEAALHIMTTITNQWIWSYLPLHLCSVNIFICTLHTITKSDKIKDFLYALCIPGAIIALIISPWFTAPVFNFMHLHSYTIHTLLILYGVLVVTDGYRPSIKRIPYNALYLIIMAIPIYFINKLLDTNFLFINKPEEVFVTEWLFNIFGTYYFLLFPFLIVILWIFMYLPWVKKKGVIV